MNIFLYRKDLYLINEKRCLLPEKSNLSLNYCNAINIGILDEQKYSCVDCKYVNNIIVHKYFNYKC